MLGCSGGASRTAVRVTHRHSGLELTVVALCDSRRRGEDTGPCGLICYCSYEAACWTEEHTSWEGQAVEPPSTTDARKGLWQSGKKLKLLGPERLQEVSAPVMLCSSAQGWETLFAEG